MRIMGLDYGTTTVGVAVSDRLGITAQEVETIVRARPGKLRQTLARIEELVCEYEVEQIVLGCPVNMNYTEGERVADTRQFQEALARRTGLSVVLWDERLTTVEAERILKECGVRRENRKSVVDQVAAAILLQNYLDAHKQGIIEDSLE